MASKTSLQNNPGQKSKFADWRSMVVRDFKMNKAVYFIAIPGLLFYLIFLYGPMYGVLIAFKDYSPALGVMGSPWVGVKHFVDFFNSIYFVRLLKNTILLNFYGIIFGFPAPIILALLLNELKGKYFKKGVQTITYLPHFISIVVICGIIVDFTGTKGIITQFINMFGGDHKNLLLEADLFRRIYIISDIWQGVGWGSIIYLAAMSGLDMELYEAAEVDGAGKFKQLLHITIPGISSTIMIMLILRIGSIMSLGADKVMLLYKEVTYETADIISTYVYRKGILSSDQSFATAVGLFNSVINCILVFSANWFSRKYSENSLW